MRLLVVTLHMQEREFDRCVAAINSQTYRDFEHVVISGLPKREAHHKMYGMFMDQRDKYSILAKIDADTVLLSPEFFSNVVRKFRENEWMDLLSVKVQDFFSNRLVWAGMNCYGNQFRWQKHNDLVFTDRVCVPSERIFYDKTELAPAATHCSDPSPFQAFHFGMHRGVKARVAVQRKMPDVLESRLRDIDGTWNHFLEKKDVRLALAALGGELGIAGRFTEDEISYTNPAVASAFQEYEHLSVGELHDLVQKLRNSSWGWLPTRWRVEALRGQWGTLPIRCLIPSKTRRRWARRLGLRRADNNPALKSTSLGNSIG